MHLKHAINGTHSIQVTPKLVEATQKAIAQMAFSRMVYISSKLPLTNYMGTYAPPTSMFPMVELDLLIVFSSAFCSAGLTSLQVNLEHRGK